MPRPIIFYLIWLFSHFQPDFNLKKLRFKNKAQKDW
jgi:hypothetical protein